MAVSDIPPTNAMASRLNELLERVRKSKPGASLASPLAVSQFTPTDEPLFVRPSGDGEVYMTAFETAARTIFYQHLASTQIKDEAFAKVWILLDILQYCGDRDICSKQLVLLLIEELLDSQSIDGCRDVFTYLESRREAIIAMTSLNKSLVILRLCNELLRRLSRADDSVFCGRVYIFLFQSFPLGDKSSVNLRGNFHTENETSFKEYLTTTIAKEDGMQIEQIQAEEDVKDESKEAGSAVKPEEAISDAKEKPTTLDIDTLYPIFWSLQESFSNPPTLFEQENFKKFRTRLEATLAKFQEVPKVAQSGDVETKGGVKPPSGNDQATDQEKHSEKDDRSKTKFNPKYLTSPDLFKLELSDLAFQRHILVQALILIDFLLGLTERSKQKPYYRDAQKAMQYSFTLPKEDTDWALGIKDSIANYLQDGPDGKFYYRMVDTVLSRDKNWVRWKMEHCTPFTRNRVAPDEILEAKSGAKDELKSKSANKKVLAKRDYLLNAGAKKGLDTLRQADRFEPPSAESYHKVIQTVEMDLDMAFTEEERRTLEERKASNTWRGLRLAAKDRLSSFDRLEYGKGLGRLFQPATTIEAASEDNAPTAPDDRDHIPQEQHQSVEEPRAEQTGQVTADTAAE
ncbi:nuclear matrix protein [Lophiotrema nucula]|uniref:Nuclear matrix protein n=1 Tax=Lophiotrema nucula TaxID=690887 RepID=A0A6A5ZC42_9PLEO|nr:nuclear matrix protein [Lophiotrema nucula]